jgi:hypothetical protein
MQRRIRERGASHLRQRLQGQPFPITEHHHVYVTGWKEEVGGDTAKQLDLTPWPQPEDYFTQLLNNLPAQRRHQKGGKGGGGGGGRGGGGSEKEAELGNVGWNRGCDVHEKVVEILVVKEEGAAQERGGGGGAHAPDLA